MWGWLEDIDLNAGAAALAAIPVTAQHHVTLSGTDTIIAPEHETLLWGIMTADETPPTTDAGLLTISGYTSPFRLPVVRAGVGVGIRMFEEPIVIPPGASLSVTGNGSGSGAEEHAVILIVENPEANPWPIAAIPKGAFPHPVEMVTDAPTAYTVAPVEYSGRSNAYENSQEILPDLDDIGVYLNRVQPELTAGYTLVVIEDSRLEKHLMFPCASTYDEPIYLSDFIGGPLMCPANACHRIGVSGVSTATQQLYLDLYITNWKGTYTTARKGGVASTSPAAKKLKAKPKFSKAGLPKKVAGNVSDILRK
jgi:hypothetical protein